MSRFIAVDRETTYLLPPSVDEWLSQNHLARFVVEVIDQLDLSELTRQNAGRGSDACHSAMLLGLLVYGYTTGLHSSRKIERACHESVAMRFIAANSQPDHDSIATFRRRLLPQIEALFVQVLMLAREMVCLKLGTIALDGTKMAANASKHSALSWEHANKIEVQLREEVQQLLKLAEDSDNRPVNDGLDVPAETARREQRLAALAQAKVKIEQRAAERHAVESQAHEAKCAKRQAQREASKKPRGPDSEPPSAWVSERADQMELFYLPSYSPQLNPEERLNADLKQEMGKRVPVRTKAKLRAAANEHMTMLEQTPKRAIGYFQDRRVRYAA
jgi:transposase